MLTDRDTRILTCLTHQLKVLTLDQAALIWFKGCRQSATRRLAELRDEGLVVLPSVPIEPLPLIESPLATWQWGRMPPDFIAIASAARRRWKEPAHFVRTVQATRRSARLTGGNHRRARYSELSHDQALAEVYRLKGSPSADEWKGEAVFPKVKGCIPDAFCGGTAIDFVGKSYTADDLAALHQSLAGKKIPYELW